MSQEPSPATRGESPDEWYEREKTAFRAWWESEGEKTFSRTTTLAAGAGWFARAEAASETAPIVPCLAPNGCTTPEWCARNGDACRVKTPVSETPRKGWRLVPEEVTTKMIGAYHDAKRRDQGFQTTWTDILNATPQEDSHMSARSQGQRSPQHEGDQHEVGIPAGAAPASVPSATPRIECGDPLETGSCEYRRNRG